MKLLAKDPEEQLSERSPVLRTISLPWQKCRANDDFGSSLASRDLADRLRVPERLYGRGVELAALIRRWRTSRSAARQLLLIARPLRGRKSSLVREVMRPVAGRRGHLISGKFDQLNRGTPYLAIRQAFEELVRNCSARRPSGLSSGVERCWRPWVRARRSCSTSCQASNSSSARRRRHRCWARPKSQTRFNLVFRRLFRALASPRHPLVIFLDDLQWADGASLALIEMLDVRSRSRRPADDRRLPRQ